jgi:hypothetical protein
MVVAVVVGLARGSLHWTLPRRRKRTRRRRRRRVRTTQWWYCPE